MGGGVGVMYPVSFDLDRRVHALPNHIVAVRMGRTRGSLLGVLRRYRYYLLILSFCTVPSDRWNALLLVLNINITGTII